MSLFDDLAARAFLLITGSIILTGFVIGLFFGFLIWG